jgi:hypothetical protein
MKEKKSFPGMLLVLYFAVVFLILLLPIKTPFNIYDEGFVVFNATRVLNGDIPYKDFWTIYPPGQFYVIAGVFKIFGTNLLISRLYDTLVRFVIVVCVYLLARKMSYSTISTLFASIMAALLLGVAGSYGYAVFPAFALCLLSILCLIDYITSGKQSRLLLTGVLLGVAMFFRWDIGLYAGASMFTTIILFRYLRATPEIRRDIAIKFSLNQTALPMGMLVCLFLIGYGMFALRGGISELVSQAFIFPITQLHTVRWLPYPSLIPPSIADLGTFKFYLPILLYISEIPSFFSYLRVGISLKEDRFGRVLILFFGLFLFSQALSRFDTIHVVPSTSILFLLAAQYSWKDKFQNQVVLLKYIQKLGLFILTTVYILSSIANIFLPASEYPLWRCHSPIARSGCVELNDDQERAVLYLDSSTFKSEPIFVGNQNHSQINVNDIGFYFLSDRSSVSYYHELYPGVATTEQVQVKLFKILNIIQ